MAGRLKKVFHTLRFQTVFFIVLFILVPSTIIAAFTTNLFIASTEREVTSYSNVILDQLCGNIDLYLADMVSVGLKISDNAEVQQTLKYAYLPFSDNDYINIQDKMVSFLSGLAFVR